MASATRVPNKSATLYGHWLLRSVSRLGSTDHICGRPPPCKEIRQCFDQIACVHMSGLFLRSHLNAGQDGFRDPSSKQVCDPLRPLALAECLASWIDRSHMWTTPALQGDWAVF